MKKIISYSFLAFCLIFAGCENKFGEGVSLKDIEVEDVLRIGVNQIAKAKAYPVPWDCTNYEFSWSSSDPTVATVNRYGTVTAISKRAATCSLTVSSGSFTKTIQVEVVQKPQIELFEETNVKHLFLFENESNLFQSTIGGVDLKPIPAVGHDPFIQVQGYNAEKKALRVPASRLHDNKMSMVLNALHLNHGFPANGTGTRVNQYTILVDIKFAPRCCNYVLNADFEVVSTPLNDGPGPYMYNTGWSNGFNNGLFHTQFDSQFGLVHNDVGFRFNENGSYGIRDVWTTASNLFQRDTWYRFIICVDTGISFMYFRNGEKDAFNGRLSDALDNGVRTFDVSTGVLFFAHGGANNNPPMPNQIEAQEVEIATLAIWDRCLQESEVRGLVVSDPDAFGVLVP